MPTVKRLFTFTRNYWSSRKVTHLSKTQLYPTSIFSQRGVGRFFVTERSRKLDLDLGASNAQCTCYECLFQLLHETPDDQNRKSPLSLFNEDTITDLENSWIQYNSFHEAKTFSARENCENFNAVNYLFPRNTTTKNAFPAVCPYLDENVGLRKVNALSILAGKQDRETVN